MSNPTAVAEAFRDEPVRDYVERLRARTEWTLLDAGTETRRLDRFTLYVRGGRWHVWDEHNRLVACGASVTPKADAIAAARKAVTA